MKPDPEEPEPEEPEPELGGDCVERRPKAGIASLGVLQAVGLRCVARGMPAEGRDCVARGCAGRRPSMRCSGNVVLRSLRSSLVSKERSFKQPK